MEIYFLKTYKFFLLKLLLNCQKVLFVFHFWKFFFLKSNIRPLKIFLKSNNLCTKKSVVATIFLKSRFFLKSSFLKWRSHCTFRISRLMRHLIVNLLSPKLFWVIIVSYYPVIYLSIVTMWISLLLLYNSFFCCFKQLSPMLVILLHTPVESCVVKWP